MSTLKPQFRYNEDTGWSEKIPWTDDECILICLENCINLAGLDKKQVERLAKQYGGKVL